MTVSRFVENLTKRCGRRVRIGLVGFGVTGRALYRRLLPTGAEISVRCHEAIIPPEGCPCYSGKGYLDGIYEDALILSPSVRRDHPALLSAEKHGTLLTSDCEIFFEGERPEVFAVSGSDGKTTVSRMAATMLDCEVVGNIGLPFCEFDGGRRCVAELSSFNLNFFAPRSVGCVITCVTPNHLDWHKSYGEYLLAKSKCIKNAGFAVLCADDEGSRQLIRGGETLFSLDLTRGELISLGARHTVYHRGGVIHYDGEPILHECELALHERHNILNFMAAVGLAYGQTDTARIREVGQSFQAPAHRCERIHTDGRGVHYIDSSIDTTPSRTATTLAGLDRRVLLLLGGRGKGLSPLPLYEPLLKYADAVAIYGEWRSELDGFLSSDTRLVGIPRAVCERFTDALSWLCRRAKGGDTVLLSPAATAYGEFENYKKRGELFADFVRREYP